MNVFEDSLAPRTPLDLRFRIGDIPVRVHPYFWLSVVILGLGGAGKDLPEQIRRLPLWLAVVFVSILIHELGHILMGRWFGARGHILLTGFCGLAIGASDLPRRSQRVLVSLAGPFAGFLFAGLVAAVAWARYPGATAAALHQILFLPIDQGFDLPAPPEWVADAIFYLLWINILWGAVNLLPIWPLDGGHVCREACQHFRGQEGMRISLVISFAAAVGLAVWALVEFFSKKTLLFGNSLMPALFFALLALTSWQLLQVVRRHGPDWERGEEEPRAPWEQDADWWKSGRNPWDD